MTSWLTEGHKIAFDYIFKLVSNARMMIIGKFDNNEMTST